MSAVHPTEETTPTKAGLRPSHISLGFKVISVVVVVWLALLSGVHFVLRSSMLPSFQSLERRLALEDIARIRGAFALDLEALEHSVKDYATWDDMLAFVHHPNASFVQANVADTIFGTLRIDLVQIFDEREHAVFAKALDHASGRPHRFAEVDPETLLRHCSILARIKPELPVEALKRSGTFRTSDGQLLELVAHPIVNSEGHGPAGGFIVLGRLVDAQLLEEFRQRLKLEFEVLTDELEPRATDDTPTIENLQVTVTSLWRDPSNRAVARLRLRRHAAIYAQGQQARAVAESSALILLTIVLVVLWSVLQVTVVRPLRQLSETISVIQEGGGLATKIISTRRDEIGTLAQNFERLLELLRTRAEALERMATSDELTSLYNRRFIMDFLHREIERSVRYDHQLAILLLDVDYFKRINDTLGHAMGDRVLRTIGRILKDTTRSTDGVGRYGGEEFLIVMPHQSQSGALVVAERVRKGIESCTTFGTPWVVTVSIGVACWEGHTREALLYVADQNLYQAKAAGRNRSVSAAIPIETIPRPSLASLRVRARSPLESK